MNMMQDPYQTAAVEEMDPEELPVSPAEEPDDPPYMHMAPFEDLLEEYESDDGAAAEVLGGTSMVVGGVGGIASGIGLAATEFMSEAGATDELYAAGMIGSASLYMVGMLAHSIGVEGRHGRGRTHRKMLGYRMTGEQHQDAFMSMLDDADAVWHGDPDDARDDLEWMGRDPVDMYETVVDDLTEDSDQLYQEIAFPSPRSDRFGVLTYADGEPAHLMVGEGEDVGQYGDIGLKIMDNRETYDELNQ